jgi:hypothetical protein
MSDTEYDPEISRVARLLIHQHGAAAAARAAEVTEVYGVRINVSAMWSRILARVEEFEGRAEPMKPSLASRVDRYLPRSADPERGAGTTPLYFPSGAVLELLARRYGTMASRACCLLN